MSYSVPVYRLQMLLISSLLAVGPACVLVAAEKDKSPRSGEEIYKSTCLRCHGPHGEGDAKLNPEPLVGDKSVLELVRVIEKTMPEDKPGTCTGDDAHAVAAYIHDAFYSPVAQARNRPPRVELARLTVRQFRHSLADLLAEQGRMKWSETRGLKAEFYKKRGFQEEVGSRVDQQVEFDFGDRSPWEGKLEAKEYAIRWSGGLFAPDTGWYDVQIHSNHAAQLWLNDNETPLIDGYVKSGDSVDHTGRIYLLGGRIYPLRLQLSKANQGVKDDKHKAPEQCFVTLQWKRPQLPLETIPGRCLSPDKVRPVFVASTPFPPDDRSLGYERGTSINKAWDQATTDAAIETAAYVADHLAAHIRPDDPERAKKIRDYARRFVEKAFRRPLAPEQLELYVEHPFREAGDSPDDALKRTILLALKSPRFLYPGVTNRPLAVSDIKAADAKVSDGKAAVDGYAIAEKLALAMWDSLPDEQLLRAAREGKLATREQARQQATRMLEDLRTRTKAHEFLLQWLKVDQVPDIAKNPDHHAGFTPDVAADLRTSLELFLDDVVWGDKPDFRRLLIAEELPLNGRLRKFYEVGEGDNATFEPTALNPGSRAGILTHPYLLASFAYSETSSPIHRGVFVSRSLLGRALKSPPVAVAPATADSQPDLTTRERVALQTKADVCMSCHSLINPLGYTLEHFDAVGRYRDSENGKPIDASGKYFTRSGQEMDFHGVRELASFLAGSEETQTAFVEQLYHYLIKQPIRAAGPQQSPALVKAFRESEFHVRKLLVEIAVAAAFPHGENDSASKAN